MIVDELKKDFGINKPFFLKDFVDNDKYNYDSIKMTLSKLVKSGELRRYDQGTYYFPKENKYFGEDILDFREVIECKYIIDIKNKIDGYYTGIELLNSIGLTTQVVIRPEIATNKETNILRLVKIRNNEVVLRKPIIKITNKNVHYLQLVDIFKYAYLDEILSNKKKIMDFIKNNNLKKDYFAKNILKHCTNKIKSKILDSGIWDELC